MRTVPKRVIFTCNGKKHKHISRKCGSYTITTCKIKLILALTDHG